MPRTGSAAVLAFMHAVVLRLELFEEALGARDHATRDLVQQCRVEVLGAAGVADEQVRPFLRAPVHSHEVLAAATRAMRGGAPDDDALRLAQVSAFHGACLSKTPRPNSAPCSLRDA